MLSDNFLRAFYQMNQNNNQAKKEITIDELVILNSLSSFDFNRVLKFLIKQKYVKISNNLYSLTEKGVEEAKKIIKAQVLWELYMDKFMQIEADAVYNSAKSNGHIISAEIEAELIKQMENKIDV